jgi:hypothetical protein
MKRSAVNASRTGHETASGAAVELGEDSGSPSHVVEVGGLVVATGDNYAKMAGVYSFLAGMGYDAIVVIIDQVLATGPFEIA